MGEDPATPAAPGLLRLLRAHMRRHVPRIAQALRDEGLSMPQMAALHFLHAEGPATISAVAAHLNLSLTATSHLVEQLVRHGLVTRTEDPSDRRRKRVAPTEQGERLVATWHRLAATSLQELLARADDARLEALERALQGVMAQVEDEPR